VAYCEETYVALLDSLASGTPTPGGGTAAALSGAMAAALCEMVANLTINRKKYLAVQAEMETLAARARELRATLLSLADEDALAYEGVVAANKLPKDTDALLAERNAAIEQAVRQAAKVPLNTATRALEVLELVSTAAKKGNKNALTDAGVAGLLAQAAVEGALYNVYINLTSLGGTPDWAREIEREAEAISARATALQGGLREELQTIK